MTEENVGAAIMQVIERLQVYNLPGTWHAGPSMRPLDIGTHLRAYGFSGSEGNRAWPPICMHFTKPVGAGGIGIRQVNSR